MDGNPHDSSTRYSIGELADAGGVSRRTVRFYVQRGLIAPPIGVGRGAYYDATHLAQLLQVKLGQEQGLQLAAIAERAEGDSDVVPVAPAAAVPPLEPWSRLQLAPGVELHLREGALGAAQQALLLMAIRTVLPASDPGEPA